MSPPLPSYQYNFSAEQRVTDQARLRAMSIAAEASLQRKHVLALQKQQQQELQDSKSTSKSSAAMDTSSQRGMPYLPVFSGTDILTPTQVAPTSSASVTTIVTTGKGGTEGGNSAKSGNSGQSSSSEGVSNCLLGDDAVECSHPSSDGHKADASSNDSARAIFKPLMNWSIKEFEGASTDPFEIASLQAINDMEVLESVLQPLPVAATGAAITGLPPFSATSTTTATSSCSGATSSNTDFIPTGIISTSELPSFSVPSSSPSFHMSTLSAPSVPVDVFPTFTTVITSPCNSTSSGGNYASTTRQSIQNSVSTPEMRNPGTLPQMVGNSALSDPSKNIGRGASAADYSSPLCQSQTQAPHGVSHAVAGNLFVMSGSPAVSSHSPSPSTNPFSLDNPIYDTHQFQSSANSDHKNSYPFIPVSTSQQQQQQSEPGVGTLVDLSGNSMNSSSAQQPVAAPRSCPKVMVRHILTHYVVP